MTRTTSLVHMLLVLMIAASACVLLLPLSARASAVTLTSVTSTSTPAYVNTGFATTTRATVGDTIQYQLTLSGTPLIAPQINILFGATLTGSTTMSGSGASWYYATTTTSTGWPEGAVSFRIGFGGTTGAEATTTITQSSLTGTNVTFDKTGPTLNSVSWSDVDNSTQFSAGDILTVTFNETMATSTIISSNVDTRLALSNSHTFGSSPIVSWNIAGTILTLTLGSSPTLATGDTVDPTTAAKDAVGNNDATPSPVAITDNIAPSNLTGLTNIIMGESVTVTLSATGASQIRYTTDSTTPTCSTGTVYSAPFVVNTTSTVTAVACDEAGNASPTISGIYTKTGGGGGSSHHSSSSSSSSGTTMTGSTQSMIDSIMAQIAALRSQQGTDSVPANGGSWTSDLKVGSSGGAVRELQAYLNSHGFVIASSGPGSKGNETSLFGGLTKAALAKFQASVGITPASGFFGPKTRAYISSHP